MTIISRKIPIDPIQNQVVLNYIRQFNNVKRRAHSLLKTEKYSEAQILALLKQMNNIDLIDVASMEYARINAEQNPDPKAIFGSNKLLFKLKNKEDPINNKKLYSEQRNKSVLLVGRASDPHGMRKIKLFSDNFIFKINKQNNIKINFKNL